MAEIAVVGGSVAGLTSALLLARRGHQVQVFEGDGEAAPALASDAGTWTRRPVPQLQQGHAVHALGRNILRRELPDVHARLLALGATELRLVDRLPMQVRRPEDEGLVALQVRRPVLEWALRVAALEQPGLTFEPGRTVSALRFEPGVAGRRAVGVHTSDGTAAQSDWVIDAGGTRSRLPDWLVAAGAPPPVDEVVPFRAVYYCGRFQRAGDLDPPTGSWIYGPTGDLGFLRYSLLGEDDGHVALTFNVPDVTRPLPALRHPLVWLEVARLLPELEGWIGLDIARPPEAVWVMRGSSNRIRQLHGPDGPLAAGLVAVGDAHCTTNPTHGWGLSLAFQHAVLARDVIDDAPPSNEATLRLLGELDSVSRPYFREAVREDLARADLRAGLPVRWDRPDDALFCRKAVYPNAPADAALHRAALRRISMLDPLGRLRSDAVLAATAIRIDAEQARGGGGGGEAEPSRLWLDEVRRTASGTVIPS